MTIVGSKVIFPNGRRLYRVLRRLGLMRRERVLNLLRIEQLTVKFWTDDGRVCVIPVSRALTQDSAVDVCAYLRGMAEEALVKLGDPSARVP